MSRSRFLVNLKEVYRSESIIKVKTFLTNNIELTTITSSLLTDEQTIAVQDFVQSIIQEDLDHIFISQDATEVITFVSGYIFRSLLKNIDCAACKKALNNDPVSSAYLDEQNQGGLKLPTSSLKY